MVVVVVVGVVVVVVGGGLEIFKADTYKSSKVILLMF